MLMGGHTSGEVSDQGDPSRFTRWVLEHPILWGVTSGGMLLIIGFLLFGNVVLAVVGGVVFGCVNSALWRSDGPALRWRQTILRRFPKQ